MKTLNYISKLVLVAVVVLLVSSNLQAQKAYHGVNLERGITELNSAVNSFIEKCKIKFDLTNTLSVSEMEENEAAVSENELNILVDNLTKTLKFKANNTITVTEAIEENSEINRLTEALIETVKFDVNETISVTSLNDENNELNQLTDKIMDIIKFDVNKTLSVQENKVAFIF